jgi:hypothetical protein
MKNMKKKQKNIKDCIFLVLQFKKKKIQIFDTDILEVSLQVND